VFVIFSCIRIWTGLATLQGFTNPGPPTFSDIFYHQNSALLGLQNSKRSIAFTTITTTTTVISSSAADAAGSHGINPKSHKFRESISLSAMLSAVTISSNVKFDNGKVLKSSKGCELWSQKMLRFFQEKGLYEIVVSGIDLYSLASAEELIIFQLA
jgi:DNA topoisomerase VI subunit B